MGRKWRAFPTYYSPQYDLCLLWVPGLKGTTVTLRGGTGLSVGEATFAIGSPEGLELTVSEGVLSGVRSSGIRSGDVLLQTTAAISAGSSGGGLFDAQARLLGLTTSKIQRAENIGFAVSSDRIALAVREATSEASLLFRTGCVAIGAGRRDVAKPALERSVALDRTQGEAWLALAQCTDPLTGRADLESATQANPLLKEAWKLLGESYRWSGILKDADVLLEEARRYRGSKTAPEAQAEGPGVNYARAIAAYERVRALDPDDFDTLRQLASAYEGAGFLAEAVATLRAVLARQPGDQIALSALAGCLEKQGRCHDAMEVLTKVLASSAANPEETFAQADAWTTAAVGAEACSWAFNSLEAIGRSRQLTFAATKMRRDESDRGEEARELRFAEAKRVLDSQPR